MKGTAIANAAVNGIGGVAKAVREGSKAGAAATAVGAGARKRRKEARYERN